MKPLFAFHQQRQEYKFYIFQIESLLQIGNILDPQIAPRHDDSMR